MLVKSKEEKELNFALETEQGSEVKTEQGEEAVFRGEPVTRIVDEKAKRGGDETALVVKRSADGKLFQKHSREARVMEVERLPNQQKMGAEDIGYRNTEE